MFTAVKQAYFKLLSVFCFLAMSITVLAFGTSCRTFLHQPQVPGKVRDLISE